MACTYSTVKQNSVVLGRKNDVVNFKKNSDLEMCITKTDVRLSNSEGLRFTNFFSVALKLMLLLQKPYVVY